ncbi:MCE family protein [Saccharopolyspora gloriosae]|uniref:MCE family protein n=1 Tax=Saccharopolyspora gloriosae TaxID=455344 RepID=UPI001FB76DA0|nr:MCE family protein [Saccharopolyspora gloriosae]
MKPFRERDPKKLATAAVVVAVLLALGTAFSDRLPFIGAGPIYQAHFAEAAGLRAGDDVLVSGVQVGDVSAVTLDGARVRVSFHVKGIRVGDESRAAIKIRTLLGRKYLQLEPRGQRPQPRDEPIPVRRTVTPYDVNDAFRGLTDTVGELDTAGLAESFRTLSDTFRDSSPVVRSALDGLSGLSRTLSERDAQLAELVSNTRMVSGTLADRNAQFEALLGDGNRLLEEVRARREAISALLDGTRALSAELSGLVSDNNEQLRPALEQLERVTTVLRDNQGQLDRSLSMAGPFYRQISGALGNGRWVDTYVCGLIVAPEDAGAPRDCAPSGGDR